jgi:site-specific recombinase XerD
MKQTQLSYPTLAYAHCSTLKPTASFQTTFNGLATAAARFHMLRDGELVLYKRPHSRVWQCRYKLFANEWHRQTTKRTVLADAVRVASEMYDEARFRERMGLAPARKSFSQIAALAVEEMRRDLAAGTGKKIYDDYIQVIERYLVPFFGDRQLQTLKHKDIAEFEVWRNAKMGRRPKSSTLMTYASAFSRVCKTATERGWLSESVVLPQMSRKGEKGAVRPAFSAEEVVALRAAMLGWQTAGRTDTDNDYRQLVCDYVEFLLLTGARHGTEAMGVSWQHCEWYAADGVKYLRIWVDGKTGGRWLIAKHELAAVLHRLHSRQRDIASKPFESVLGRYKGWLFRTEDGRRPYSFNGLFRRLLRHCQLLTNHIGATRTLYSIRHTYATMELLSGTDIHTLAKQMGTSVAMLETHYSKLTATMAADRLA